MIFSKLFRSVIKLSSIGVLCFALAGCSTAPPADIAPDGTESTSDAQSKAPSEMVHFESSEEGLSDHLKEKYTEFSFDYPADWQVKEAGQTSDAQNFVKVERTLPDTEQGEFTLENFAVGYFTPSKDAEKNEQLYSQLTEQMSEQFATGFPNYQKTSEGKTKIGAIEGYEFRFQSRLDDTARGPVTLWGRTILLPKPDSTKGVSLVLLASSLAPEIESAADVGEKGELAEVLKSFKLEK